jgi:carboxyl-terminal processing protease
MPRDKMAQTRTDEKKLNSERKRAFMTVAFLPDIQRKKQKTSPIANALLKNDGIFNYATAIITKSLIYREHKYFFRILTFLDFVSLKTQKISFTETEQALKHYGCTKKKK